MFDGRSKGRLRRRRWVHAEHCDGEGGGGRYGGKLSYCSTLTPCWAAKYAAVSPAAPAPTIKTSGDDSAAVAMRYACRWLHRPWSTL